MTRAELLAAAMEWIRTAPVSCDLVYMDEHAKRMDLMSAYDALPLGRYICPVCNGDGTVANIKPASRTPPSGSAEGRESGDSTATERAATDKALAALDSMAETWAASINLRAMLASMDKHPDRLDRFFNMVTQGWVEGAYEGRTSLQHSPPVADDTTVRVPRDEGCICHGNWRLIVGECRALVGKRFKDSRGDEFRFFGIVCGDDDYYYGMSRVDPPYACLLLSCVGSIDMHGFSLIAAAEGKGE